MPAVREQDKKNRSFAGGSDTTRIHPRESDVRAQGSLVAESACRFLSRVTNGAGCGQMGREARGEGRPRVLMGPPRKGSYPMLAEPLGRSLEKVKPFRADMLNIPWGSGWCPVFRSRQATTTMDSFKLPTRAAELDGNGPDQTVAPDLSRFDDGRHSSNAGAVLVTSRRALQMGLGPDGSPCTSSPSSGPLLCPIPLWAECDAMQPTCLRAQLRTVY